MYIPTVAGFRQSSIYTFIWCTHIYSMIDLANLLASVPSKTPLLFFRSSELAHLHHFPRCKNDKSLKPPSTAPCSKILQNICFLTSFFCCAFHGKWSPSNKDPGRRLFDDKELGYFGVLLVCCWNAKSLSRGNLTISFWLLDPYCKIHRIPYSPVS